MARHFAAAALMLLVCVTLANTKELRTTVNRAWAGGMQGIVSLPPLRSPITGGWHIKIEFDYNIFDFEACEVEVLDFQEHMRKNKERSQVILGNRHWNADMTDVGEAYEFKFLAKTWKRRKGFTGAVSFFPHTWSGDEE